MSFTLENSFGINHFQEQALEIGFMGRNPLSGGFSQTGEAIVLYDEALIKTAERLQKNINLMRVFAHFVFLIVAVIGFLISYLFMQSRRGEFAIMRSLSTKKSLVFFGALLKSLVLSFTG